MLQGALRSASFAQGQRLSAPACSCSCAPRPLAAAARHGTALQPQSLPLQQHRTSAVRALHSAAEAAPDMVPAASDVPEGVDVAALAPDFGRALCYGMKMAHTSETYEMHPWMLLLGVLRYEDDTAAKVLRQLGLDDIYGAWHEVLWALNVADGLEPRAYSARLMWQPRAYAIANGAVKFAGWAGRELVHSEDLLLALAAGDVLEGLFPDLDLNFDKIKHAIEKTTGCSYQLPGYTEPELLSAEESFF